MGSRSQIAAIGIVSALMFGLAACYPFQGDVTLLLTPVPSDQAVTELPATDDSGETDSGEAGSEEETEESAGADTPTAPASLSATVNTRSLRVRQGPSTSTPIVAGLRDQDPVNAVGRNVDGEWIEIEVPGIDTRGWVSREFLDSEGDLLTLAVSDGSTTAESGQEATPTPLAMASSEEANDSVRVGDQEIRDGTVLIDAVTASQPGWIVVHADDSGTFGPVVGQAAVAAGENLSVVVSVDLEGVTETLYAMLHIDSGETGVYEFPGADGPVLIDGAPVSPAFAVTIAAEQVEPVPAEEASAEETSNEEASGEESASEDAVSEEPASEEAVAEESGDAEATTEEATEEGAGETEGDETEGDETAGEEPVADETSEAREDLQPTVEVSDQELVDGTVQVDRVYADQPGWIVIHADDAGTFGRVLGQTQVNEGENLAVQVSLDPEGLTETLYAMLHIDAGEIGVYEFPGADAPILVESAPVSPGFRVTVAEATGEEEVGEEATAEEGVAETEEESGATEEGTESEATAEEGAAETEEESGSTEEDTSEAAPANALVAGDQVLGTLEGNQVFVEQVSAEQKGWVVIHADSDGAPGPVLGQSAIEAGTTDLVVIDLGINEVDPGSTLWAMLHIDEGSDGVYEFPGPDGPVTVDGSIVMEPFIVIEPAVLVDDQSSTGSTVTVRGIVAARPSWIVIHESKEDGSILVPESVGLAPIAPGTTPNVTIDLSIEVVEGTRLWAMLHHDRGVPGEYEFPGVDVPVTRNGAILMEPFTITAGDASVSLPVTDGGPLAFAIAEVNTRSLRVRAAPSLESEVIAGARQGEFYAVVDLSEDSDWAALALPGLEEFGWAATELLLLTETDQVIGLTGTATVSTDDATRLRVRDLPSSTGEITGRIQNGARYPVVAQTVDKVWTLLNVPTLPGPNWVATEFITIE